MGDRADRKTGLVFLLIALAPVILVSVLAFIIGLGAIVYGWPALLPMLVRLFTLCVAQGDRDCDQVRPRSF